MSTRSIVAFDTESGVVGVYVHYDGYPSNKLAELGALVARDGAGKVTATILERPAWASLEHDEKGGTDLTVPGYGRFFDDRGRRFTPDQLDEWWDSEYIYVLSDNGDIRWAPIGVRRIGAHLDWNDIKWRTGMTEDDA